MEGLSWASFTLGKSSAERGHIWRAGALEQDSASPMQTWVAIFQEVKALCLIGCTCEYRDPNVADFVLKVFRISFNLLIPERRLAFLKCLTFLQKLSPRELRAYHNTRKWKYRECRD